MKTYLLFVFTFLVYSLHIYPQWTSDPNSNLIVGYGSMPEICSDSAGGCYITYQYGYPFNLALEKLDKFGYKSWPDRRQILGEMEEQWNAKILEDGQGGVIICYIDETHSPVFTYRLRIQRVDSAGNFLLGQNGVRVTTAEQNQETPGIVSDGNGGCIVVWAQRTIDLSYEYRINRINQIGQRVWSDTGVFLERNSNSDPADVVKASDGNYFVQIRENLYRINDDGTIVRHDSITFVHPEAETEGGIVLNKWVLTEMNWKLAAQRQDSLGNILWPEPYVEIGDSLFVNTRIKKRFNNNICYFSWTSNKNGVERLPCIQGLHSDGSKLFENGAVQLSTASTYEPWVHIIPADNSSNVYVWSQQLDQTLNADFAKRIDTNEVTIWSDSSVLVNQPALSDLCVTTDCCGGVIGTGYISGEFAIRVFKISSNGILGEVPVELISFTREEADNGVILKWRTATETNNKGFEIQIGEKWDMIGFVNGAGTTTETQEYSFIHKNLLPGKYRYRLKQIDFDGSFQYSDSLEITIGLPDKFALYQNYPNPFNPDTRIKYSIAKETNVNISVYDILGERVAELKNEVMKPGNYEVNFKAESLPSGVYFYTLRTREYSSTKKMILIK